MNMLDQLDMVPLTNFNLHETARAGARGVFLCVEFCFCGRQRVIPVRRQHKQIFCGRQRGLHHSRQGK